MLTPKMTQMHAPETVHPPTNVQACILCLATGSLLRVRIHKCADKAQVQHAVSTALGYLPSDCTDCFWMDGDEVNIAIRVDATPGRIAHEAYHAVSAVAKTQGLNPNDYELVRPRNDDFGYIPAEVCADLCEQIVDILSANTKAR